MGWVADLADLGGNLLTLNQQKKNKPKLYENTFEGREMARLSKTGVLTPQKMSAINTLMHTMSGGASNVAKSNIRGRLVRSGMDKSIAATTPIARLDTERMRNIGQAGTQLGLINAQSKQDATLALAQGKDASRTDRRNWRDNFYANITGGGAKFAASAFEGYEAFKDDEYMNQAMSQIVPMMTSGNPDQMGQGIAFMQMIMSGTDIDLNAIGSAPASPWVGQQEVMGGY